MKRKLKANAMSLLLAMKERAWLSRPLPLATIPAEEIAAFGRLREILAESRLLQFLDKKQGERFLCVDEDLISQHYPGLDPLAGGLSPIDAFIYVYDGITAAERPRPRGKGDLRQFLGEVGFRQMLLALDRACKIHRFCAEHLRPDVVFIEPITQKPTIEARKEALGNHARAREVFQIIARNIQDEMAATDCDTPQVYRDAYQFACAMREALEPLARIAKQVRAFSYRP